MAEPIVASAIIADWGPIRAAASSSGLVAVDQLVTAEGFADRLERRFGRPPIDLADAPRDSAAARQLEAALAALGAYLVGDLAALAAIPTDLADRTGWDRLVLAAVRGIPAGATASYGEVARMIGKAGAARAVGGAVGRNPIGLVIPCHRVIAGDGTLGGYGAGWWGGRAAGLELKRELLAREGVTVRS
ncbi:MAG TPA: MGMT family protein [Candidatus Binatus sp.]|nr:MGMT family protein [Candidatus Binatus sp.]